MKCKFSRRRLAALVFCACVVSPTFADNTLPFDICVLSWAPPRANDDGSPLTDLAGYYIYTGNSPDTLIPSYFNNWGKLGIVLIYPPGGTHYFAVTAVNVNGFESSRTPVVSRNRP
jgi:hypothetical protein